MDASRRRLLEDAYERFNARDVDAVLAMMAEDIEWPDVAGNTVLRSKEAVRAYWEAQFAVGDPRVTPTDFVDIGDDLVAEVEQVVRDLDGQVVVPRTTVFHRYAFAGDLVRRMRVFGDRNEALALS